MRPKISVVMPTYNRANVIQHAIRSVIDQSFKNWELIVVDDGSTDATKRVVESFFDPRITFVQSQHVGFVSQVRNIGNKLAKGDIVVVHDSDDQAFPDRLEEIIKAFEKSDADLVYHGMYLRFYDPYHDAVVRDVRPASPFDKDRLLKEQYIPGQVAYRREAILEIPYDERIRCCDDYQLLLEFALNNKKFVPIYRNLYEYYDSLDSINVVGELDGSRRKDVEIILSILKEKYKINARATMFKNVIATSQRIKEETI